jgi:hypothetical protein
VPEKVTPDLADALGGASKDQLLDVVVELAGDDAAAPAGDRAAKVAYMKQSFQAHATPLEELIRSLGGEVLASAWLNRTIHARVPARAVPELARTSSIAALDRPHELTPERPA